MKIGSEIQAKTTSSRMVKISIIVPVYNVEKYIEKCLQSLVNQTLNEIEIIVVNDGSPDNSQEIIDKYAKKYKCIKSFVKKNGGLGDARNYGIKRAIGEYIAFIDSDDYVSLDCFENMYKKAKEKDYDVVVCDINYIYPDKVKVVSAGIENDIFDKDGLKKAMQTLNPMSCNKIYKRTFFEKVNFKKGIYFEDVEFTYRLLFHISSVGYVKKPFLQYLQNPEGISKKYNEKWFDYFENVESIVNYYIKNNSYEEYKEELEYIYARYLLATFIKLIAVMNDRNKYNQLVQKAIEQVKKRFPYYRKNKYLKGNMKGFYLRTFNKGYAKILYLMK
jgi:Glycosyltransferases involved in cell wall biogenesis